MCTDVNFRDEGQSLRQMIIGFRRRLHRTPELSGSEFETCRFIRSVLAEHGLPAADHFPQPATVVTITGEYSGPVVALRADIDALPIQEENQVDYCSVNNGVMHACGHDAHTAMLLGAAILLGRHRKSLRGSVKLIFQPSEEAAPSGAKALLELGVLERPKVDVIFAHHVQSHIACGQIGVYEGAFMAAADNFRLIVHGKSCHAAHPQRGVDAIWVSSQIITAFQSLISRFTLPVAPAVLSICTISGGTRPNIIADTVTMYGTLRTLERDVREDLISKMHKISSAIAEGYGAACELEITPGYPAVCNDKSACAIMRGASEKILGRDHIAPIQYPSTGSEDFAWYQQSCRGVISNLGCGNPEKGLTSSIHTPTFDIDENCLPLGAAILAQCAWDYMDQSSYKFHEP
ncbi:amidohydrolase [Oscillibacter sp. MSJ-2]|uniref:Amidohydrolase n=1 Tax=Dysosmobacter acutus TaxID=2841504 RepID=A0ABS6F9Y7_9FIRM|nr:M20 family metallopeptidase [Dysosmobacter acutus]MBU5627109.1 amidohydrolase [Dysosmobacter acutus]